MQNTRMCAKLRKIKSFARIKKGKRRKNGKCLEGKIKFRKLNRKYENLTFKSLGRNCL